MSTQIDEIACYPGVDGVRTDELAFLVRAVNLQAEQLAQSFDVPVIPARAYTSIADISGGPFAAMALLNDIDQPGALGFHDVKGLPFGRCKIPKDPNDGTTLSHECAELARDPYVNLWLPLPDGRHIAYEVCDPCQNDQYPLHVTIGDETRTIWVSDFVLPAYFVDGAPGPYSYCDNIDAPFGVSRNGGGWRLVKDTNGAITSEYGSLGATVALRAAMLARAADPGSRTYRRGLRVT